VGKDTNGAPEQNPGNAIDNQLASRTTKNQLQKVMVLRLMLLLVNSSEEL
jgi:hypothetical protein